MKERVMVDSNGRKYITTEPELKNNFNPDWDAMAVMVEEQQRMAKHIEELEAKLAQPDVPETAFGKTNPVAWADRHDVEREGHDFHVSRQQPAKDGVPLYTAPPKKEPRLLEPDYGHWSICPKCQHTSPVFIKPWVGLTIADWPLPQYEYSADFQVGAQWAEATLKERNT